MTSPSEPASVSERLAAALEPVLGAPVEIAELQRLTGGASRETWSFTAERRGAHPAPGSARSTRRRRRRCAARPTRCARATAPGCACPRCSLDDDGTLLGTTGLVMRRVAGRDHRPAHPARRRVRRRARRCSWASSAGSSPACTRSTPPRCPAPKPPDPVGRSGTKYLRDSTIAARRSSRPTTWLVAHRPPHSADALIHGDLRMGNVIVGPSGLAAVIDWELVHRRRSARGPRLAVPEGMALRRAARGGRPRHHRRARRRLRSARAAARSTATRCTGGWSRRRSRGASGACCRPTST